MPPPPGKIPRYAKACGPGLNYSFIKSIYVDIIIILTIIFNNKTNILFLMNFFFTICHGSSSFLYTVIFVISFYILFPLNGYRLVNYTNYCDVGVESKLFIQILLLSFSKQTVVKNRCQAL